MTVAATPESEKLMAQCARALASHLIAWAKDRRDEDKKAIAAVQSELCALYRKELNGTLKS
jgi:hypothetical protein